MKIETVVSEFEGTLLKNKDTFSYFMLLVFHASGLIRFTVLLCLCPVIALLDVFGRKNIALKLIIFVATFGLRESDIEQVARAVVPKFYMEDLNMDTWMIFSSCKKKVVVTSMPRIMVEWFAKEHLAADEVIGPELIVNRFGFVIGLVRETDIDQYNMTRVAKLFVDQKPCLGLGKPTSTSFTTFMSLCEEKIHEAGHSSHTEYERMVQPPKPVIFHASRLVKRPTPTNAIITLVYIPFGIVLATIRILVVLTLPRHALPYVSETFGIKFIVKGKPTRGNNSNNGLLFVCNHRSIIDPFMITMVLGRKIPIITTNLSRFYDIFCPVPMVRFTRNRDVDATTLQQQLSKGDVVMCPEGAGCFQPFVMRFSPLFAELTNKIMPVAINCKYGFFENPKRSWDVLDIIMLFMNPTIVYEVTFLNQLRLEETCFYGKSSYDVANHVQRILASTLGFQCTSFNRKEMVRVVFGKS